ncbi:ATP-dependent DNA helicase [Glaciihabitans sp. UYNi722]|uniref:ATP-dependent helicase n=1 Tax=Glaciihabitans sp. UYNi722 TaxID=3156344 RepID=UPI003395C294
MISADQVSAFDIADALGRPRPTVQQREVIESPLAPAIVVAGAGSGKTETMANRVLWLLANGHVKASEILGLTFTRKAAGELSARIRERIGELHVAALLPGDYDEFDPPVVATYNSFSNTIYRDNAVLLGRESDGAVLGEASSWQLARSIVIASTDERLPGLGKSVDAVTRAVIGLSHALSENVVEAVDVATMAARFAALADLPSGGSGAYEEAVTLANTVGGLPVLIDLAEQFSTAKARRGFVEYSDQVSLALQIVRKVPTVAEEYRERFRVVLLDEYQDTSVVQTWLLAELFAGLSVMAVGDPNQSIYGWRGASAANLEGFAVQFGSDSATVNNGVQQFALSTSWRNGHGILAVANALVEPLAASTGVGVDRLEAGPAASSLPVGVIVEETLPDEADAAALWLKAKLATPRGETPPTAAMLFRARKTQSTFIDALRHHGVPFHVLGIGGLMAEPEIADLVSALTVTNDPTAGSELVRLLAGSRWRIGPKDLHGLSRLASWLRDRDYAQQPIEQEVKDRMRASVAEGEGGSIVDAIDFLATARDGHSQLERFSDVGLPRLREAGRLLARLRSRAGLDLLDFVTFVEQELMLDIEVAANETRSLGAANMEAFFDALGGYLAVDDSASLGGFLGWLKEAEWRDGLAPRPEDAEPGTVQLLTIHGSKGLEWDIVVVPRMVENELPGSPREGFNGWLSFGSLPYGFRGDAAELPDFPWQGVESRKQLLDAQKEFKVAVRDRHLLEERRLAYVAVTRARHSLLLTASFWASQTTARKPSPFLVPLAEAGVIGPLPFGSEYTENPLGDDVNLFQWPLDPLGGRRAAVERAAELVRDAVPGAAGTWERELDLLIEERRRRLDSAEFVEMPSRVPASRFKDFVTDPASVASSLRRPMPERPYRATNLGTLFHSWVEDRYGVQGASEELDALPTELDLGDLPVDDEDFARLRGIFERSEFAALKPEEVEIEIHLILDGEIVVCKLDAVYLVDGRYRIVDWKTGKAPRDAGELEARQLQLALYRQAFAEWKNIDPEQIDAVFYYVSDDAVIRPERIYSKLELVELWRSIAA